MEDDLNPILLPLPPKYWGHRYAGDGAQGFMHVKLTLPTEPQPYPLMGALATP